MKCKNCDNETENNRVYCSLTCRNIYVNTNLRDYSKVKETCNKKRKLREESYYNNPKHCKQCGKIISFENKRSFFCDHSCSASYTNKGNKGRTYILSDEGRKNLIESAYKNLNNFDIIRKDNYLKEKEYYYEEPKKCLNCEKILEFNKRNHVFCDIKCKKDYYWKNLEDFNLYKSLTKFKFSLNDFNDYYDFGLIENYGWYKAKNNGDNVDGVSRDHMISVKEGFRKLINPLIISHPANCELIINKKNQSKSDSCSLTIEELLNRIEKFEIVYGEYYSDNIKTYIDLNELKEMYNKIK